jgi:hypothetical protein
MPYNCSRGSPKYSFIIMQVVIDEIEKADLAKLHNEVNQLRNHEFLVCSFALALVGSTASVLSQEPTTGLTILLILAGLYAWHLTIMDSRSRITTFLRASRRSNWEILYREFADTPWRVLIRRWGQRNAAVIIFLVLGLAIPLISFRQGLDACLSPGISCTPLWNWAIIYGILELAYLGFVVNFGIPKNYNRKLEHYMARWRDIIQQEYEKMNNLSEDQLLNELTVFSSASSSKGMPVDLLRFIATYHSNSVHELIQALRGLYLLDRNGKVEILSGKRSNKALNHD